MFIDLLRKRRSIRRFQERTIEPEKIDTLVEAMLRSPSSRGINPWNFIVVTDRDLMSRLAQAKTHGSAFLVNAPLAIVVCGDSAKSDVWIEDTSIASLVLHLCSTDLGLGSCWIQIRQRQHNDRTESEAYVRDTLDIRPDLRVEAIVAIGYPAEEKKGHDSATLNYACISYETYGKSTP